MVMDVTVMTRKERRVLEPFEGAMIMTHLGYWIDGHGACTHTRPLERWRNIVVLS